MGADFVHQRLVGEQAPGEDTVQDLKGMGGACVGGQRADVCVPVPLGRPENELVAVEDGVEGFYNFGEVYF